MRALKKTITGKLFIILIATLVIIATIGVIAYIITPKDLGPKLHYIGKKDYGCLQFPLFFICPNDVYSVYYYATDLTQDDLKSYFKSAQYVDDKADGGGSSANYSFAHVNFKKNNKDFVFTYYNNTQAVITDNNLKDTSLPYIISIGDFDYDLAKSSL